MLEEGDSLKLSALIRQCSELGCQVTPGVFRGGKSEETGKGLYAAKSLKKGQLLFMHPLNGQSLFNLSTVMKFRSCCENCKLSEDDKRLNLIIMKVCKNVLRTGVCDTDDFFATTVSFMIEFPFSSSSHLQSYLEWLPTCFPLECAQSRAELDSPLLWHHDYLAQLKHSSLCRSLEHFVNSSRQKFNDMLQRSRLLSNYLTAVGLVSEDKKWQYFKYCACVVQGYSFTINVPIDEKRQSKKKHRKNIPRNTMIPLMDAFNASNKLQNVHLLVDLENKSLECRTTMNVLAGKELFNTFGELDVADRVIKYGYVEYPDIFLVCFCFPDVIDVFDDPNFFNLLTLMFPHGDFSISPKKRKSSTLNSFGYAIVNKARTQWLSQGLFEDYFNEDEFRTDDILSARCVFDFEDFLCQAKDNDEQSSSEDDFDAVENEHIAVNEGIIGHNHTKVYSCEIDLEQYSLFAFLNCIVECLLNSNKSISREKIMPAKAITHNVYSETMILFHLLLIKRIHLFENRSCSDSRLDEMGSKKRMLVNKIIMLERKVLAKFLRWNYLWLCGQNYDSKKAPKIFEILRKHSVACTTSF